MESGNASTPAEPQATVFATTNGSFENQLPAATTAGTSGVRKRGISALLQDITNVSDESQTRRACLRAKRNILRDSSRSTPRGNPAKGAKRRHETAHTMQEPTTLSQLMGNMSATNKTLDNLQAYTQRNVSYEIG